MVIASMALFILITAATIRHGGDEFKNLKVLPKNISADKLAVDALDVMRKNNITQLLVIENEKNGFAEC